MDAPGRALATPGRTALRSTPSGSTNIAFTSGLHLRLASDAAQLGERIVNPGLNSSAVRDAAADMPESLPVLNGLQAAGARIRTLLGLLLGASHSKSKT